MDIPVVRAQHVNYFLDVLRDIGAPVERHLERSRLPLWISEVPNDYVSLWRVLDCMSASGRDIGVLELGFLGASKERLEGLSSDFQRVLLAAHTGWTRLEAFMRMAHRENSALAVTFVREGEDLRLSCETPPFVSELFFGCIEWANVEAVVSLMRSIAGPDWSPIEITFVSNGPLSDAAGEAYRNTRMRLGQPQTSILFPARDLAGLCHARLAAIEGRVPENPPSSLMEEWTLVSIVRALVRPYLRQGVSDLDMIAEIACTSRRTLQRQLEQCGQSFSRLVKEARFEVASSLLADASIKIVDVAFAAGYENPQHFSRAFRQFTGMTPGAHRRQVLQQHH